MTAVNILKTEKAAEMLRRENKSVSKDVIANWDVPDIVGVRGYDVRQLWDFTAHSIERMVYEVLCCYLMRINSVSLHVLN